MRLPGVALVGVVILFLTSGCTTIDPYADGTPATEVRDFALTAATLGPGWQVEGASVDEGEVEDVSISNANGAIGACLSPEISPPIAVIAAANAVPSTRDDIWVSAQTRLYRDSALGFVEQFQAEDKIQCLLNALADSLYAEPGQGVRPDGEIGRGLQFNLTPPSPLTGFAIGVSMNAMKGEVPVTLRTALLITAYGDGLHLTQIRVQVPENSTQGEAGDPLLWAMDEVMSTSANLLATRR